MDSGIHTFSQVRRDCFTSWFVITQIQNNPGSWGTIQTELFPPAYSKFKEYGSETEEVQSHWKGFCISMWLKCVTHSGSKRLNLVKQQNPTALYTASPVFFWFNHSKEDFPRLTVHLLVVRHILWQHFPQFMWLWIKKPHSLKDFCFPVKYSGIFLVLKPFLSMDPIFCPLPFKKYYRHVLYIICFISPLWLVYGFNSWHSRNTFHNMVLISRPPSFPTKPYLHN